MQAVWTTGRSPTVRSGVGYVRGISSGFISHVRHSNDVHQDSHIDVYSSRILTVGGLAVVPEHFTDSVPDGLVEFWPTIAQAGRFLVAFLAIIFVVRVVLQPAVVRVVRQRNKNNPTIRHAMILYFRLLGFLVAIIVGAGVAGYADFLSNSALVISAVALAIGVAAQEVIGSIVSGIALVLDPEFNVGDHIEWSGGEGIVRAVALRITRIETHGGELITVPNTIFTNQEITRPYGRGNYRIIQTIGLEYETDVPGAMSQLEDAATAVDAILADPPPKVFVDELGDDAVIVRVHYWVEDPTRRDVFAVRSMYAQSVVEHFDNVDIPFNSPSKHTLQGRLEIDRKN